MSFDALRDVARLIGWAFKVPDAVQLRVDGPTRGEVRGYIAEYAPALAKLLQKHMEGGYFELTPPPWTPFERATITDEQRAAYTQLGLDGDDEIWLNSRYQVNVRYLPESMTHLSIKRIDKQPHLDWRDLQRIKNELCGPEREAVEIFPKESRLVDSSNQRHAWVYPAGFTLPFGLGDARFVLPDMEGNALQRPFEQETA